MPLHLCKPPAKGSEIHMSRSLSCAQITSVDYWQFISVYMDEPKLIMTTNIGSYNNSFTVGDNNEYYIFNHM